MNNAELRAAIDRALGNVAPEIDLAVVADDADLREELDIDSIGFLDVVTELHARTGVDIPEIDYPKLRSRAHLIAYLRGRLG